MNPEKTTRFARSLSCLLLAAIAGAYPAGSGAADSGTAPTATASEISLPAAGTAMQPANAQRQRIRPLPQNSVVRPVRAGEDHIYGRADAPTSLLTYMDFACPYCRKLQPVLLQAVNGSSGDINWVYRQFPLAEARDAPMVEAMASECAAELAGEMAFWEFSRTLMMMPRRQSPDPAILVQRAALKQGLDWPLLQSCIESDRHRQAILEDREEAVQSGVVATPTTVLMRNGQALLLEGLVTTQELKAALDRLGE